MGNGTTCLRQLKRLRINFDYLEIKKYTRLESGLSKCCINQVLSSAHIFQITRCASLSKMLF